MNVSELERWLDAYGKAWEQRDADGVCRIFNEDALYYETPFAEPFKGHEGIRSYWSSVTADQRDIRFESRPVGVVGSTGIAHWSARFKLESNGANVELDGVFLLEFDADGRCKTLREWWHAR
jgi:ketosteroid isomerase-like protein